MRIAITFTEVDRVCDYIPFVSTASNIVDLFQKCVYKCLPENIAKNRYWSHINWKDVSRCLILLVPILGNIYIAISDYSNYQKNKASCNEAIRVQERTRFLMADMLALLARQVTGEEVTAEQMMPAPTEDQQHLWAACLGNDAQPIRDLLARSISPNFYHSGQLPLVIACQYSTTEVVRLLIEGGADVNTSDRMGISPFAAACMKGNFEMVQLLRSQIADIDVADPKGMTPLIFAAASGHREIVEFLIGEGADLHKKDVTNSGDAATNAMFLEDVDLLSLLFPEHENIDDRRYQIKTSFKPFSLFAPLTIQNLTPLLYATLVGAVKSAIYLVGRSNVQHVDSTNCNALYYASKHMPLLQALLNKCHTAEFLNQQNIVGSTALHHAIELDRADAALLLLQNGADPFIPDNEGKLPLLLACEKDFVNVIEYIKQHYADLITVEIGEQVAAATQAAIACRNQTPPAAQPERQDGLSSALFGLMETSLKVLQSVADMRGQDTQEVEDLGPMPRSGMEMIFGKLPWPA
ncbi:MAG: ankyrin repeat domain-containing protein [Candidatus Rhabdochlamydia sp.]